MKKILSIILCLSMLVSSVAFAAPVNMAPIDVESVVEQQMTLAGTENDVYTLSFASAGTDVILPDSLDVKQGDVVDLSKVETPTRDGYAFLGWKTATYSEETVDSIKVEKDTTLYASWAEGVIYNFNTDGDMEGWKVNNATSYEVKDGVLSFTAASTAQLEILNQNIDADKFKKIEIMMSNNIDFNYTLYFKSTANNGYTWGDHRTAWYAKTADGVYKTLTIDMSPVANWKGTAENIRFDINTAGISAKIDYIRLINVVEEYVDIAEIETPVAMGEAATTAQALASTKFDVTKVEWQQELYEGKYFNDGVAYTVNITVAPKAGVGISDTAVATVGGKNANISKNEDGTYLVTYTYPEIPELDKVKVEIDKTKNAITTPDGTLELSAKVLNADTNELYANQDVVWSVETSVEGSVILDGNVLTALYNDDNVTVTATSVYDRRKSDTFTVAVSGQTAACSIQFKSGTTATVNNLPAAYNGKGPVKLSQFEAPTREGYVFLGWMTDRNATETVDSVFLDTEDITLTAKWGIGARYEFNTNGDMEGWKVNNATSYEVKDGVLSFTAASASQLEILNQNINADKAKKIEISMSNNIDFNYTLYFKSTANNGYVWGDHRTAWHAKTSDGEYKTLTIDMSPVANWKGTAQNIRFDINTAGISAKIDYIRLINVVEEYVDIAEIEAPVAMGEAATTAQAIASSKFEVTNVEWEQELYEGKYFNDGVAYTVNITVAPKAGVDVSDTAVATIGTNKANISKNDDGTYLITYTYPEIPKLDDVKVEIDKTKNAITKPDGTLELSAKVKDAATEALYANQDVVWTVETSVAGSVILDGNVLTAVYNDDNVTVTATSAYDRTKFDTFVVAVSGQTPAHTIEFNSGTNATVNNLPEYTGKGTVDLSQFEAPTREGYVFLGWMTDPRAAETVDSVVLKKNMTLTAKWGVGAMYEFNTDDDMEGWVVKNAASYEVKDGALSFTAASTAQLEILNQNINADKAKKIEIMMSNNIDFNYTLYFKSTANNGYAWGDHRTDWHAKTAAGVYKTLTIDMSPVANWKGTAENIRFDINTPGISAKIDYIHILEEVTEYIDITDIATPVAKEIADTTAVSAEPSKYTVQSVSWSPELLYNEYHNGDTEYTVIVKVAPTSGNVLSDKPIATINGNEATVSKVNADGTLELSYTFPDKTDPVDSTEAIDVKIVQKSGDTPYTKTKKLFVGEKMTIDSSLVDGVASGKRFIGWAEVDGDLSTVFEGEFVAESGKNRTFYAQYEDIVDFDYSNKYHQTQGRHPIYDAYLTFSDGAAVVKPITSSSDAKLATDSMYLLTTDYAYAEVVYDAELSTAMTVNSKPGLYFSYASSSTFASERSGKLISAEEIMDDGRKAIKYTYDLASNDLWKNYIGKLWIDPYDGSPAWAIRSIKLIPAENTNEAINITGIVAPKTWETPNTAVDEGTNFTVKSVTWDTSNLNDYGAYKPDTPYTVTVVVRAKAGYKFNPEDISPVTINGAQVTNTSVNTNDNTLTAVYTFTKTDPLKDVDVTVSGATTIARAGRYEKYTYIVKTVDGSYLPMSKATFSISKILDENGAEVDNADFDKYAVVDTASSRLYPILNCTVTLRATSVYNTEKFDEIDVVITNQGQQYLVTYDLNTIDTVSGSVPAPEYAKGEFVPADCTATREGLFFKGWSLEPDEANVVTSINVTGPTTLYAIWTSGERFEFNTDGYMDGWRVGSESQYSSHEVKDGVFSFTAAVDAPQLVILSGISINADVAKKIEIKMSNNISSSFRIFFKSTANKGFEQTSGNYIVFPYTATAADTYQIITIDMSGIANWKGTVSSIRIDPALHLGLSAKIDYIRIHGEGEKEVVFNANGGQINGSDTYSVNRGIGTYTVPYTPVREGYAFIGWAPNADGTGKLYSGNTVKFVDDITFYAVWAAAPDLSDETIVTTQDEADADSITVETDEKGLSITSNESVAPVIAIADDITVDASSNTLIVKFDYNYSSMTDDTMYIKFTSGGTEYTEQIKTGLASKLDTDYISVDLSGIANFSGDLENVALILPEGTIKSLNVYELSLTSADLASSTIENFYTGDNSSSVGEVTIGGGDDGSDQKTYAPVTQPKEPAGTLGGGTQLGSNVGTNNNAVGGTQSETNTKPIEFEFTNEFTAETFVDVTSTDWFYGDVEKSYKLGLMNGMGGSKFDPDGAVTIAQAITVAARIHAICNNRKEPKAATGSEWYTPYVNYAIEAKIITNGQFTDYTANATRKQVAQIFANCTSEEWLNQINTFSSIPGVVSTDIAFKSILKLYNAGIIIGVDETHKFNPYENIKRSEMSAIINRIALPESRIKVETVEQKD